MSNNYLTTPWQNQEKQTVLQELRRQGYNVEQNNGKTTIVIGNKSYEVDLNKPIWTIMAEIGKLETENKRDNIKQNAKERADSYHQMYENKMENIIATKIKRNIFLQLWQNAKKLLNKILGKNNVETAEEIKDSKDKKLAIQYSDDATMNKFNWIWAGNDILSDCNDALGYALKEGEWSTIAIS